MNFVKRAWTSVKRRVGKTVILLILVFILGNVIAGAISIQQAVENTDKNIRKSLGGYVTAELDYDKIMQEQKFDDESFRIDYMTAEQIEKIGESQYVKYYDYTSSASLQSDILRNYQGEGFDERWRGYAL